MIPFPTDTEALLFDCDGTLVDSMPIHVEAWHETMLDRGIALPEGFIDHRAGMTATAIAHSINVEFGVEFDLQAIADEKEARYEARMHEVEPIDAVLATARAYHSRLAMAVVSGSMRRLVIASLETIGAIDLFSVFVTSDDPVAPKPSPEIFLEAARQLSVAPNKCHVFEDGDAGIVGAREAGMTWTDVRKLG